MNFFKKWFLEPKSEEDIIDELVAEFLKSSVQDKDVVKTLEKPEDLPVQDVPDTLADSEEIKDTGAPFKWSEMNWLNGCDISNWSITSYLKVSFSGKNIILDYDKAKAWTPIKDGDGEVSANAWVFLKFDDKWYGSTWEWMRPGQKVKLKEACRGDHIKMQPLKNWIPQVGDELWFCVSGLARLGKRNVSERTDIVRMVWQ